MADSSGQQSRDPGFTHRAGLGGEGRTGTRDLKILPGTISSIAVALLVIAATSGSVRGQTIGFETFPNGSPTAQDGTPICDQYNIPPYNVSFRNEDPSHPCPDPNMPGCDNCPVIAAVGPPQWAFLGCQGADDPAPGQGVGMRFLTDDPNSFTTHTLVITYSVPVAQASGVILDVDRQVEQWTVTAYDARGGVVDTMKVNPPLGDEDPACNPLNGGPGNGEAVPWGVKSSLGLSVIKTIRLEDTSAVGQVGFAFDNFNTDYCPPGPCCMDLPEGMVAWWTLDAYLSTLPPDPSGVATVPDIIGRHVGHIDDPVSVPGEVSAAMEFGDPNRFITVASSPSLNLSQTGMTIDAWAYLDYNLSSLGGPVVQKDVGSPGYSFAIDSSGYLHFTITYDFGMASHICQAVSSIFLDPEEWKHIAATISFGTSATLNSLGSQTSGDSFGTSTTADIELYIDGLLAGSASCPVESSPANTTPLIIGGDGFGSTFNGMLDEVEIFDRPLPASTIQMIYQAGSRGKCKAQAQLINCPTLSEAGLVVLTVLITTIGGALLTFRRSWSLPRPAGRQSE